jgi:hypothetical protein
MTPPECRTPRRGFRRTLMVRLRIIGALSALGLLLALAAPTHDGSNPRIQPVASAIQERPTVPAPSGRSHTTVGNIDLKNDKIVDADSWFNDPIGRMTYAYRVSRGYQSKTEANIAIAFVDITGLANIDPTGYQVMESSTLKSTDPALYDELGLADRPSVQRFAIVAQSNNPTADKGQRTNVEQLHAELRIFQQLRNLSPSDGGASITPNRIFALYSDRSPCLRRSGRTIGCSQLIPATTDVFFAVVDQSANSNSILKDYLDAAESLSETENPVAFKEETALQTELREERVEARPGRENQLAKAQENTREKVTQRSLFQVRSVASLATSAPCAGQQLGEQAGPCTSASAEADAQAEATAAADNGLAQALAEPNVASPGGIDFSHLQLDYLSDPGDGSGLQYAFEAPESASGGGSASGALGTAGLASDAFFVWLELDPSADWVNLNPTEPDRVVDAQMGRTDMGRVMLQADLALKKDVGALIHPDTALGSEFWSEIEGDCLSSRVWVVPSPAQAYSSGDQLYILKAPLNVEMETRYIQMPAGQTAAVSCPRQSAATQAHNEALFRSLVLPKLVNMVNTDPSFADLRTIYRSRVAAEWYRDLSASRRTTYADLIDQGDIGQWTTKTGWTPAATFDQYMTSYTKGDYHVTQTVTKGDEIYTYSYTYGGVDLTEVPLTQVSSATFAAEDPGAAHSAAQSLTSPTTDTSGMVMFGSTTPLQAAEAAQARQVSADRASGGGSLLDSAVVRRMPLLLIPIGFVLWRRRRHARANPR